MTSFHSDRFNVEEHMVDLGHMVELLGKPDPSLVDPVPAWEASKAWMRAGLVFICTLAQEGFEEPRLREGNQAVAQQVWYAMEPFFESLEVLHEVDAWKRKAESEMNGVLN